MAQYRYRVVDVFTRNRFEGNQLAVFLDSAGIDAAQMQRIANEMNLSETVFLQPTNKPECATRLRIFTPRKEMDFAGHPTIGTASVLLQAGLVPQDSKHFFVEENVGPIAIRVDRHGVDTTLWLDTPKIEMRGSVPPELAARLLQVETSALFDVPAEVLDAGNPTLFLPLRTPELVDSITFSLQTWPEVKRHLRSSMCVFAFAPTQYGAYSRMFAPDYGVPEDPATGSSTGPLAAYMMRHGMVSSADGTRFISEQGTKMGRRSLLHVAIVGDRGSEAIRVGGEVTPVLEGVLTL